VCVCVLATRTSICGKTFSIRKEKLLNTNPNGFYFLSFIIDVATQMWNFKGVVEYYSSNVSQVLPSVDR